MPIPAIGVGICLSSGLALTYKYGLCLNPEILCLPLPCPPLGYFRAVFLQDEVGHIRLTDGSCDFRGLTGRWETKQNAVIDGPFFLQECRRLGREPPPR